MSGECQIHDLRLSFIWVESLLHLIKIEHLPGSKLAFLNSQQGYVSAYDDIQNQKNVPGLTGLQQPWPPDSKKNNFWSFYLETKIPGRIHKDTVWQKLVPFYHKIDNVKILSPAWLTGRIVLQSFIYPHSIALILTAEINQQPPQVLNLTLAEAVAVATKVRRGKFQAHWSGELTPELISLDELAARELKGLRDFMLGPNAPLHEWSTRPPFSVTTIVSGSNVERDAVPDQQILCFLNAVTRWPSYDWNDPPPGDLPEINPEDKVKVKEGYAGDIFHIAPRGRAVWYPKHFLVKTNRAEKLSCYHKNLNLLSMQVDSLGDLVEKAAAEINSGTPPASASFYEACVQRAAINLSFLYLGGGSGKKTYRSWSAKRQIEQNNYLAAINSVRDSLCSLGPI